MQIFRSKWVAAMISVAAIFFAAGSIAQPATYTDLGSAPAGEYTLDKTHGYITFSYSHQGYSRPWLRFRDIDSTLSIDNKNLENSTVSVSIDAASIDSGVDIFDEHLRDDEKFFNVAKYPTITFSSTEVKLDGVNLVLTGDLTMKGVTKSITLEGQFNQGGKHFRTGKPLLGFSATGTLKRSDWDLGFAAPVVSDEVSLVIEVEYDKL